MASICTLSKCGFVIIQAQAMLNNNPLFGIRVYSGSHDNYACSIKRLIHSFVLRCSARAFWVALACSCGVMRRLKRPE